ncbi:hypothetical protein ABZ766_15315 [Streptomyces sp. NPDC006670]|uniref:hypothetical protein n=1 Tax=Streptomyces sp. NPDC006670 TaxID=3154476 RepID=UPI0034086B6D
MHTNVRSPQLSPRPAPPAPGMYAQVAVLAAEAEALIRDGTWVPGPEAAEVARRTAAGLAEAVGPGDGRPALPAIERLEHLREALAVLALGTARIHGQLAWFLARASTALAPVLQWRTLTADQRTSFGTVVPTPAQLLDAERAVRHVRIALARAGSTLTPAPAPHQEPDAAP